jgi:aminoglycoside/choline kinase family phosphotransferase
MIFPLPITVDEVTPRWLTAALRTRAPGVTVRGCEVLEVIHSTTTKIRMRLDRDPAAKQAGIPERIIVKGGFQAHGRELANMHLREVRGYRDVFPEIPLPVPACFFADFDPVRRQGIVILEDLAVRGVEFCHATRPQTQDQVARRLSVLAAFHARTWGSPELERGGRWGELVDFFDVMRPFFDKYTSAENWQRLVSLPRGVATSVRFHDRQWMIDAWDRVTRFGQQLPYCVLHGDVHLGNLYIDTDGTPGFLDTLASRGPGMLEVSYHVSASVDVADRPRWESALVRHYLDELGRNGVRPPDFAAAMRQYGLFLIYGHFIWVTTESHFQTEAVNTANAMRVSSAMIDHDIMGLLASL